MNREKPNLVSVIVITYNSAAFVLETLESIKRQTCEHLELIISDDCSSDNTVNICKDWLAVNETRFLRTQLITVEENTGIPANCNRGLKEAKGEWIKLIAGDDVLFTDCISSNIDYTDKNPDSKIVISNMISFVDGCTIDYNAKPSKPFWTYENLRTLNQQYQSLIIAFCGNTPTLFISSQVFDKVQFDEAIQYMEDYPFILNVNRAGYFINYLNKTTVAYRINPFSASNYHQEKIFNDLYKKNKHFNQIYRYPDLPKRNLIFEKSEAFRKDFLNRIGLNKKTPVAFFLFNLTRRLNPFGWMLKK